MTEDKSTDNVHKAIAVLMGLASVTLILIASLMSMVSVFVAGSTAAALLNAAIILFGVGLLFLILCIWSATKVGKT